MRRTTALAGLAVALSAASAVSTGAALAAPASREYVVLYQAGASSSDASRAIAAAGGTLVHVNRQVGVATVRSSSSDFAHDVAASPAIESAAANRSIGSADASRKQKVDKIATEGTTADAAVNPPVAGGDPLSGQQWDMAAIGATPKGS